MKLFISGPVTGKKDRNIEAFEKARAALEYVGYQTEIPHDYIKANEEWHKAMRISLHKMLECDGVAHLDEKASLGSSFEVNTAIDVKMPVHHVSKWVEASARRCKSA